MSYNKVILIGNVGRDPEVKYFDRDHLIATFSLATQERGWSKGGEESRRGSVTDWHTIRTSGRIARWVEENVRTGDWLLVEGHLSYRTWSARDGRQGKEAEVVAERVNYVAGQSRYRHEEQTSDPVGVSDDTARGYDKYTQLLTAIDPDTPF